MAIREELQAQDNALQRQINEAVSDREHHRTLKGREHKTAMYAADRQLKLYLRQSDEIRAQIAELEGKACPAAWRDKAWVNEPVHPIRGARCKFVPGW